MSKKQNLTPWFPASVKPALVGVYQRLYDEGPAYCRWNGKFWSTGILANRLNAANKASYGFIPAPCQDLDWRGLAEQPKEQKQ